jgi:hypothetical protein
MDWNRASWRDRISPKTAQLEVNFSAVTMISTSALAGFCANDIAIPASRPLAIKQE